MIRRAARAAAAACAPPRAQRRWQRPSRPQRSKIETFSAETLMERQDEVDKAAASAWPYGRYLHPSSSGGRARGWRPENQLKFMLQAQYGEAEGERILHTELLPRMAHIRQFMGRQLGQNKYAFRLPAADGDGGEDADTAADTAALPPTAAPSMAAVLGRPASEVDVEVLSTADVERLLVAVVTRKAPTGAREGEALPEELVDACRQTLLQHLQRASVWMPMQLIHVSAIMREFGDDIPEEYRGMAEMYANSAGADEGDVQPAFVPLPGREEDPSAPPFLPIFLTEAACAEYTAGGSAHVPAGGSFFPAEVALKDLIADFEDSPQEVVIGLNHRLARADAPAAPRQTPMPVFPTEVPVAEPPPASLWLGRREQGEVAKASTEAARALLAVAAEREAEGGVGSSASQQQQQPQAEERTQREAHPSMSPEDAAAHAQADTAQAELQQLLDGMISYLKCMRSSVRFGYINAQEVAGEELIHIGLAMATPENDYKHPLSPYNVSNNTVAPGALMALATPPQRRKRRKRPKMTPRRWMKFQLKLADELLKQKPIDDLVSTEEPDKPTLKKLRGRYVTAVRRVKKRMAQEREAKLTMEQRRNAAAKLLDYGTVLRGLKEHPVIAKLSKESFVGFHDVNAAREKHPEGSGFIGRFDGATPFYDNDNKYGAIDPHFNIEDAAEEQTSEAFDTTQSTVTQIGRETYLTLLALRREDSHESNAVSFTQDEEVFLTEKEMGSIIIGEHGTFNKRLKSDAVFHDTRRRYLYMTQGIRAASQLAPPGYTPRSMAIVDRSPTAYLYEQTEVDTSEEHEQIPGVTFRNREEYLRQSTDVAQKARELGVEVRELRDMNDEIERMDLTKDQRRYGPWHMHRASRRFGTAGDAWATKDAE